MPIFTNFEKELGYFMIFFLLTIESSLLHYISINFSSLHSSQVSSTPSLSPESLLATSPIRKEKASWRVKCQAHCYDIDFRKFESQIFEAQNQKCNYWKVDNLPNHVESINSLVISTDDWVTCGMYV